MVVPWAWPKAGDSAALMADDWDLRRAVVKVECLVDKMAVGLERQMVAS